VQSSWHIRVPKGYRIRIRFRKDFHVEDSTLCHKDALVVAFDKTQKNTKLFCGKKRQKGVTSSTNELWLIFRTDNAGIAKGFFASYRTIGKRDSSSSVCFVNEISGVAFLHVYIHCFFRCK
jgi:hypothetical protein